MKLLTDAGIRSWGDAAALVAFIAGLVALVRWAARGAIKTVISNQLSEVRAELVLRTEPIQPDSNGGNSLPDLHLQVAALRRSVGLIDDAVDRVELGTRANNRQISELSGRLDDHLHEADRTVAEAENYRKEHTEQHRRERQKPPTP